MKIDIEKVLAKMSGHDTVPDDWMPATGMRPLQQDDPGLLWLKFHGEEEGFEKDTSSFAFTPFISRKGQEFEATWILKEAPSAVRAMEEDWDVRKVASLRRTLELMEKRTPVIAKAALWHSGEKIYGSADIICLQSWLFRKFKSVRPEDYEYKEGNDHYVILDMKFTSGLHTYGRREDLEKYACQLGIYAYALSHMQRAVVNTVYIVSRDRVRTPIKIETAVELDKPLEKKLRDFRNEFRRIKLRGDRIKPWTHDEVAVNPQNPEDFPFHGAKEIILTELVKGQSLTMLPGVGNKLADALEDAGYECVADLLKKKPEDIPLEDVPGIGTTNAARIRAVLQANRSEKATKIPIDVVPPKVSTELFVDYEFLSNVNCDMEKEWPVLDGTPMVAMIGVAWRENGRLRKEVFRADSETHSAELKMFRSFVALLESKGVFDESRTAALYCWGDAERAQTLQAIERHPRALKQLANLPWFDLLKNVIHEVPIAIPGMWSFGLKEVATALSEYSKKHAMSWPDGGLSSGQAAQVALWECYRQPKPDEHEAWALTAVYLKSDLEALDCVLRWVRDCTKEDVQRSVKSANGSWYRMAVGGDSNPIEKKAVVYAPRWYTAGNKEDSPTRA